MAELSHNKPDSVSIARRDFDVEFSDNIPKYWAKANPVITAFYNALSTVIPEGERFFMHSLSSATENIQDEGLKKDIRGFMSQEGQHLKGHVAMNRWIESKGYPVAESENQLKRWLGFAQKRLGVKQQLAATAALEHFSAIMCDQFLRHQGIHQCLHPQLRDFLAWHCIEENEHKAVVYDVYQQVSGSYLTRIMSMLLITLFFVPNVFRIQFKYLWHDRQLFNGRAWLEAFWYCWINPGWFSRVTPGYMRYFKFRFHPWQSNNEALINRSIERFSPGPQEPV